MTNDFHNRVDLAVEQLHVAIDLLLNHRSPVSALTLAGAADEVIGRKAERCGSKRTLGAQYEVISKFLVKTGRKAPSFKAFAKERNKARNTVKHMDPHDDESFMANLPGEAIAKIASACNNYERCGFPLTDKMLEFHGWYYREQSEPGVDGA